jgi:hypothetical protein
MISKMLFVLVSLLAAAPPELAQAQLPTYAPAERERLLARTGEQLALEPVPNDPVGLALELALIEEQLGQIDVTGINWVQATGFVLLIGGAVNAMVGVLGGLLVALSGNGDAAGSFIGLMTGIGLPIAAAGGLMIGLAELDPGLQRRRELGARHHRLRHAQRYVQPGVFGVRGGGGFVVRGAF